MCMYIYIYILWIIRLKKKTKNTHSNAGAAILFAFLGILSCEKAPSEVSEIYFKYNIYIYIW